MGLTLEPPIQSYLELATPAPIAKIFSTDAVVHDEGHLHTGPAQIAVWWQATQDKYRPTLTPLAATQVGDKTRVTAKVAGDFPNSPVTLQFDFTVQNDRITALEIG